MVDQITEIRARNLRCLADVRFRPAPSATMTGDDGAEKSSVSVLIGANGSGKSSLIEALAILRLTPEANFIDRLNHLHGGLSSLLRFGTQSLGLGIGIAGLGSPLDYDLALSRDGDRVVVERERLGRADGSVIFERDRTAVTILGDRPLPSEALRDVRADQLLSQILQGIPPSLLAYLPADRLSWLEDVQRLRQAMSAIEIHPPFDVTPAWVSRTVGRPSLLRQSSLIEPAEPLGLLGQNLANVFHSLKNDFGEEHWQDTLEYVRLGLGDQVEGVNTRSDPGGGTIALRVKYRYAEQQVPAHALSDGTLAYLAFVAMCRMGMNRSILLIDEPEAHFHPHLQVRVLALLQELRTPVVLATHSDRLIDALEDPAQSAFLCQLDDHGATHVLQPDPDALEHWLKRYRGIGEIRTEGHEASVMTRRSC